MKAPETFVTRSPDGQWHVSCHFCPNRSKRLQSRNERIGGNFATRQEAREQLFRHRQSDYHKTYLQAMADTKPTDEAEMLARVFDSPLPEPCERCGWHHSLHMRCERAATLRARTAAR